MEHIRTQDPKSRELLLSSHTISSYDAIIKELLENSLDANATNLDIEMNFDAVPNIKISDNGNGMSVDCMRKLCNRYYSSKSFDENSSLMISLGFRGEALSSIISMAKSVKVFSADGSVLYNEGILEENSCPKNIKSSGATFIITDPFYKVPVRKRLIAENVPKTITKITALVREYFIFNSFSIRLLTRHKEKDKVLLLKECDTMAKRIFSLFNFEPRMCSHKFRDFEIKYAVGVNFNHFIAVKSRPVFWKKLSSLLVRLNDIHGINIVAIDVNLTKAYDVNVDPDKRSVFISEERQILIEIEDFFRKEYEKKLVFSNAEHSLNICHEVCEKTADATTFEKNCCLEILDEKVYTKDCFKDLKIVGNFNNSFIIIKLPNEDVFLVDQHAADERANLERIEAEYKPECQILISPIEIDLDAEEAELASKFSDSMSSLLGFSYTLDLDDKLILSKVPIVFDKVLGASDLKEVLQNIKIEGRVNLRQSSYVAYKLASKACKSSIRLGDAIDTLTMHKIVSTLLNCENPWVREKLKI